MKQAIWEYIDLTQEEKESLWENSTFVFDTNVLLNLYRYSAKTQAALLDALRSVNNRTWVPNHVAREFAKRRYETIYEATEKYNELEREASKIVSYIQTSLRLNESDAEIEQLKKYLMEWIGNQKKQNLKVSSFTKDDILTEILDLFNDKVGIPYTDAQINELFKEGETRYKKSIPPGYKDKMKGSEDDNIYGDLIIWKQIIDYAKAESKNVIFITHDQKEDWWFVLHGKTIGPRVELRKEFTNQSKQDFYMYSMQNFIAHCTEKSGKITDQSIIDEVKQIDAKLKNMQLYFSPTNNDQVLIDIEKEIDQLVKEIGKRIALINDIDQKYSTSNMPKNVRVNLQNLIKNSEELKFQLSQKLDVYNTLSNSNIPITQLGFSFLHDQHHKNIEAQD